VSTRPRELERAAAALATRLPESLGVLARLAYNYRWAWAPDGPPLFESIDPERWRRCGENPVRLLQETGADSLARAAGDEDVLARAAALEGLVRDELAAPAHEPSPEISPERPVAFFCAEYGVHGSLPVYSGGLGALAGDILKEASDRRLPLVAVGLLYRQGYFRQRIDGWGWQHEYWVDTDPERLPAALVEGADGAPLTISVPIGEHVVTAQVWRVDVGRVPLFLLDAARPENDRAARWITARLYTPDSDMRLAQYLLLGAGGARALAAMGIEPGIVHLNEGHAAFASLGLADRAGGAAGDGALQAAMEAARARTVFTTHTPVPAGNDAYPAGQVASTLRGLLGQDADAIVRMGRTQPDEEAEPFGVTQFALRTSRAANGVSRRHGEVAREMWHGLWPETTDAQDVPITHVTNGVHVPSWIGPAMRALLDHHLGEGWRTRATDPASWADVEQIPAAELWAARREQRAQLVDYVRDRAVADRLGRDEPVGYAQSAAEFDPDVLTVGFARRLATYKRLGLLVQDVGRALAVLGGDRPVQLVIAGKAHPRDDDGKRLVQGLFAHKTTPGFAARVVYLDDYDMHMARWLVRGCDVWVNLPRPPLEASGTSGMKAAVNGGLNLSVLDGWWAEAYDGTNGWSLSGAVDPDHGAQDARDGAELLRLLEAEIVPAFYDRDGDGLPQPWLARVRASLRTNGPAFSAGRMLEDYERRVYSGSSSSA